MAKPTGKLKFAYETIANMEAKIKELKNTILLADGVIENLKPYSVEQRRMVNSYIEFNRK